MSKAKSQAVTPPEAKHNQPNQGDGQPKPLSGSKKVKNQNHSRSNHGEGS